MRAARHACPGKVVEGGALPLLAVLEETNAERRDLRRIHPSPR